MSNYMTTEIPKKKCPACLGTGDSGDDNDCMACLGTGEVNAVDDEAEDPVFEDVEE